MEYEYDPIKDEDNRRKHGVSLRDAVLIDWDSAVIRPDVRYDYGEERKIALGYIGMRLYCVIFVDRDGTRRIISLRKANTREEKTYAST